MWGLSGIARTSLNECRSPSILITLKDLINSVHSSNLTGREEVHCITTTGVRTLHFPLWHVQTHREFYTALIGYSSNLLGGCSHGREQDLKEVKGSINFSPIMERAKNWHKQQNILQWFLQDNYRKFIESSKLRSGQTKVRKFHQWKSIINLSLMTFNFKPIPWQG